MVYYDYMKIYTFRNSKSRLIGFLLVGAMFGLVGSFFYKVVLHKKNEINNKGVVQFQSKDSNETLPITMQIISPQGVHILVRLADTDKTRQLGLSYFSQLPENQGMLFSFPQVGTYGFWMKDMNFPIDIIWIDENLKIIDRTINVLPSSFPNIFTPKAPVNYVLEIPANTADQYGFFVGAQLTLQEYK